MLHIFTILCLLFSSLFISPEQAMSGISVGAARVVPPTPSLGYISDSDCVGAWYMNDSGTTETDRSTNSSAWTNTAATQSSDVASGFSGYSRYFGGSTLMQQSNGSPIDINGPSARITFCFKVKVASLASFATCIDNLGASGSYQYYVWIDETGTSNTWAVRWALSSDGTTTDTLTSTTTNYALDTWYSIACVYDGTNMIVYVNGVEDGTLARTSGIYDANQKIFWGKRVSDNGGFPTAYFDEIAIFKRALTPSEVLDIHTNGIDGTNGGND